MAIPSVTKDTFASLVLASEHPVLVDFWASWCGPCRAVGPIVEELATDYEGQLDVFKLNVDEEGALAQQYGVQSIPTLILFSGGEIKDRLIGLRPKEEFQLIIDAAL
jgi:thioredoxin 1